TARGATGRWGGSAAARRRGFRRPRSAYFRQRPERGQLVEAPLHGRRQVAERPGLWRIRHAQGDRGALVAGEPRRGIERDLREQRHVVLVGETLAAALTEDRVAL